MQVFKIDKQYYYTFETYEVEEPSENEITMPVNTDSSNTFYKPKWKDGKWIEGWSEEEILQWKQENSQLPQEPNKIEILEGKILKLEEKQNEQDILIEDIVFEVIPNLDVNKGSIQIENILHILSNKEGGMVQYLATKIKEGRNYEKVFSVEVYKIYKDEVDKILNK